MKSNDITRHMRIAAMAALVLPGLTGQCEGAGQAVFPPPPPPEIREATCTDGFMELMAANPLGRVETRVERTDSLMSPSWQDRGSYVSTSPVTTWTEPVDAACGAGFYRLSIETLPPYFSDDFEGDLSGWTVSGWDWDVTEEDFRNGSRCLTDSPSTSYTSNADASASMARSLDLSSSTAPILSFWHKLDLTTSYRDYAYVEVSTNGGVTWSTLRGWYEVVDLTWQQELIDLSACRTAEVRIRFRLRSDADGIVGDGWHIDDVRIGERDSAQLFFPFSDDFESGVGNWATSGRDWAATASGARSGSSCLTDSPATNYVPHTDASATLGHAIDLSSSTAPVLNFWHKLDLTTSYRDYAEVEVSTDGGFTWSTLRRLYEIVALTWHQETIDLTPYRGTDVRIRFRLRSDADGIVGDGWTIDDVQIREK